MDDEGEGDKDEKVDGKREGSSFNATSNILEMEDDDWFVVLLYYDILTFNLFMFNYFMLFKISRLISDFDFVLWFDYPVKLLIIRLKYNIGLPIFNNM